MWQIEDFYSCNGLLIKKTLSLVSILFLSASMQVVNLSAGMSSLPDYDVDSPAGSSQTRDTNQVN
jgi:hypothetical protein